MRIYVFKYSTGLMLCIVHSLKLHEFKYGLGINKVWCPGLVQYFLQSPHFTVSARSIEDAAALLQKTI